MVKRQHAVADAETDPFKHGRIPQPFMWGFYDGTIYKQFHKTKDFVDYIKELDIILYAHNGGKFDWHFLSEYIEPWQKIFVISGRIASVKIGKCELRDSYNLIPQGLASYQKTKIDYAIFEKEERNKPNNWLEISKYLKDDCVYLYELVSRFIDDYGLNMTLAGSAMKFYRANFYKGAKEDFSSKQNFHDFFQEFYYGGRVECFQKGIINKPFKVYDINSAYPFAMSHLHPWGTTYTVDDKIPKNMTNAFFEVYGTARGCFPYREKNKLYFPNDDEKRTYKITGWELKAAKELGLCDVEIIASYYFPITIEFTDYVKHFYEMKAATKISGDKAGYIMSKLFMNSLYGKFAANPQKYNEYQLIEQEYIDVSIAQGAAYYNDFGSNAVMQTPLPESQHRYYNVATAASITGFVRSMLLRQITKSSGIIYCDTDSIACVSGDFNQGAELGQWECEGEFVKGGVAGKKMYVFEKADGNCKIASKGVKLNKNEIYAMCSGETVQYKNIAPTFSFSKDYYFLQRNVKMT